MLYRSKAPLRLGLAGGGTDVVPYCDIYGGIILNATIDLYAYATIEPRDDGRIVIHSVNKNETLTFGAAEVLPIHDYLQLQTGVYNRVVKEFTHKPLSFTLTTSIDAPPGSGLGTSSTLAVAVLGAFREWLKLPLGEYDMASLAFDIERIDLKMAGGKQDQYAAMFGGVNFMEFSANNKVIVNPLRIRTSFLDELSHNLMLYYTETSRLSSQIIESQSRNVRNNNVNTIEAMHQLKVQAVRMKEALLQGKIDEIGEILDFGWRFKKQMADEITNPLIDRIYETAMANGATGGKISGAGGGGYMFFYCPANTRYAVIESLKQFGGQMHRYAFAETGLKTWTI